MGVTLPLALGFSMMAPAKATDDVLQCVPYARELSGIAIRGDAWTWWDQAKGRYARGNDPRPGAVLALANTGVMPLGHVAVVSRVVDERHILLRHANWSGPGLIETDVMAVDSSPDNDWSQVRIWWGQRQQMGARDNPVNGFIYPDMVSRTVLPDKRDAGESEGRTMLVTTSAKMPAPQLRVDPVLFRRNGDALVTYGRGGAMPMGATRTLAMIVRDIRHEARLP
jgi:hypothetical protein